MKYLIIGAGGTGGCIGGYLDFCGYDVTFVARGSHLKAIQENGLTIHSSRKGLMQRGKTKVVDADALSETFDVIFVCVKGYSLLDVVPVIRSASHENTIVIPILNSLNAAERLADALPEVTVLGGCVYLSAYLSAPGEITQGIKRFMVVFGNRPSTHVPQPILTEIQDALLQAGVDCLVSPQIGRDTFRKFSFTSPYAAAGAYYDVPASDFQHEGKSRALFIALIKELLTIAEAAGLQFETDLLDENMKILDDLAPDTTASLQKDLRVGKESEIRELVYDVLSLAEKHQIDMPYYRMIADYFKNLR